MLVAKCIAACVCGLLAAAPAWSQIVTGSIAGSVEDPSGLRVPAVEVSLVQTATARERKTVSNEQGDFLFTGLDAGAYTLTVAGSDATVYVFDQMDINRLFVYGGSTNNVLRSGYIRNATIDNSKVAGWAALVGGYLQVGTINLTNGGVYSAVNVAPWGSSAIQFAQDDGYGWINIGGGSGTSMLETPSLYMNRPTYASGSAHMTLLDNVVLPHGRRGPLGPLMVASIDHALWFHRPARVDDWLLYVQDSPAAAGARGFARGSIFARDVELPLAALSRATRAKGRGEGRAMDAPTIRAYLAGLLTETTRSFVKDVEALSEAQLHASPGGVAQMSRLLWRSTTRSVNGCRGAVRRSAAAFIRRSVTSRPTQTNRNP